jgi:pimeloyl-ACP methyl ester carboxylesterase
MSTSQTIVLIHGLWMTPTSWDTWAERYRAQGHTVIVPGWPGIGDRTVADIRRDPSNLKNIGINQIVDHYAAIIAALPVKPIIMGHSFGGLFAQMLADRGLGSAIVGVTPGQPAGITVLPASTLKSGGPVLSNPFNKNGVLPISKKHFRYTFGNDLTQAESDVNWERNAVPSYNRVFFEGALAAFNEKNGASHVDYAKPDRAPLLVITGEIDHVVPPVIGKAIVKKYTTGTVDYKEFAGRTHRIVSQVGWEEVADYALDWAVSHSK